MGFLANRLKKRLKHIGKWARRNGITCFRVYHRDIPEYPLTVDLYEGRAVVWLSERTRDESVQQKEAYRQEAIAEIKEGLNLSGEGDLYLKERRPGGQYRRSGKSEAELVVSENGLKFLVNLSDYHDTGLFLDHRQTRALVAEEVRGKSFLNLFAYTGSFTVYAAAHGARHTTSVDLSSRYLDWAERNLALNGLDNDNQTLIEDDVLEWLKDTVHGRERFDVIVCDPPTFSNSKMTSSVLDIKRDHPGLIKACLRLLNPGGILYFSTNKRGFSLQLEEMPQIEIKEITAQTVPLDFENAAPHRCWRLAKKLVRVPAASQS
ncbi:class I SAM-dependent methyltransferase [bacterium]|nr:class I SAM-dependent methyltransferase [bacterium]